MGEADPPTLPDILARLALGERIFLTLHRDPLRERIDVRTTQVLGLEGDVLFLAQTDPPVSREMLGVTVEAALLLDESQSKRPVGYAARLLDIREDFPLPDHALATALALSAPAPQDFFETSLRMHHRVPVDEDMGVLIKLGPPRAATEPEVPAALPGEPDASIGPEVSNGPNAPDGFENPELLDFSAGGARVRLPGIARAEVGDVLPFKLLFLGSGFADGDGVVRSAQRGEDGESLTLGLFFTNMEIRDIRYLERMVARIVSACSQRQRDAQYI